VIEPTKIVTPTEAPVTKMVAEPVVVQRVEIPVPVTQAVVKEEKVQTPQQEQKQPVTPTLKEQTNVAMEKPVSATSVATNAAEPVVVQKTTSPVPTVQAVATKELPIVQKPQKIEEPNTATVKQAIVKEEIAQLQKQEKQPVTQTVAETANMSTRRGKNNRAYNAATSIGRNTEK